MLQGQGTSVHSNSEALQMQYLSMAILTTLQGIQFFGAQFIITVGADKFLNLLYKLSAHIMENPYSYPSRISASLPKGETALG